MLEDRWLDEKARDEVRTRIGEIERQTAAEVVVTVNVRSGRYRYADHRFGAALALVMLLFYLFYPEPFLDDLAIALVVAAYVGGAFFCSHVTPLRRLLVSGKVMEEAVRTAARARFYEQGISQTRARTGVLVYVSLFERRAEVVPDSGIPTQALGEEWRRPVAAIEAAVAGASGLEAFLKELANLGSVLSAALPRAADDVNELPDEVVQS